MQRKLKTDRLILRDFTSEDAEALLALFGDARAMRYLPGTKNRWETEEWLAKVFNSYRDQGYGPWAVVLKRANTFLGYCGLYLQKDVDGRDEVEILYGLIRRYWGKGYATEAAKAVFAHGKTELKINRFVSLIAPENIGSSRVAQKIGLHFEKTVLMWGQSYQLYATESAS